MEEIAYGDFQVEELVNETLYTVLHKASSDASDVMAEVNLELLAENLDDLDFNGKYDDDDSSDENPDEGLGLSGTDLARAHWIQLQKINKQASVIQNCFIHILNKYRHIRPTWQFGKKIRDNEENWKGHLYEDFYFRHHCASVQAAVTLIMENKDDEESLRKLLNEIGAHHFFYDAAEPHLHVFEEGMMEGMKKVLHGPHIMDKETEDSWRLLLSEAIGYVAEGIAYQRVQYLRQCMTCSEMTYIRSRWERIVDFGLQPAGQLLCEKAIKFYADLLDSHGILLPLPDLSRNGSAFQPFSEQTIEALDRIIATYDEECGFANVKENLQEYVIECMVMDVCPTLVRKAFIQGLLSMISIVLGKKETSETAIQTWSKLYRVLEQAIVINIVEY